MNDLITERPSQHQYRKPLDLLIQKSNQISFRYKSFRNLAPTTRNTLPAEIQALIKLHEFKTRTRQVYNGPRKVKTIEAILSVNQ